MGALPRHPNKQRKLPNAERRVAFTLPMVTFPAGTRTIRFYRNVAGRVDR